jgi:uncharacterized MAPEG superfamily protein
LALIQIVLLPLLLNLKNFQFLLSNREDPPELTALQGRINRASSNLQESLPAFLVLAVLAQIQGLDLALVGSVWLALRGAYLAAYGLGIALLRTLIWMAALVCLIYMALAVGGLIAL